MNFVFLRRLKWPWFVWIWRIISIRPLKRSWSIATLALNAGILSFSIFDENSSSWLIIVDLTWKNQGNIYSYPSRVLISMNFWWCISSGVRSLLRKMVIQLLFISEPNFWYFPKNLCAKTFYPSFKPSKAIKLIPLNKNTNSAQQINVCKLNSHLKTAHWREKERYSNQIPTHCTK